MEVLSLDVCLSILLRSPNVEFASSSSLVLVQVCPAACRGRKSSISLRSQRLMAVPHRHRLYHLLETSISRWVQGMSLLELIQDRDHFSMCSPSWSS